jgi:hypothetical protein
VAWALARPAKNPDQGNFATVCHNADKALSYQQLEIGDGRYGGVAASRRSRQGDFIELSGDKSVILQIDK